MLREYVDFGYNKNPKVHYFHSHLNSFYECFVSVNEKQGERLH